MNLNEELRQAITALFLSGADEEHDSDELLELLEDVDFDAIRQALLCEGRHIYEFEVGSEADESMNYRSFDLFGTRALCLQREVTHKKRNVFSYSFGGLHLCGHVLLSAQHRLRRVYLGISHNKSIRLAGFADGSGFCWNLRLSDRYQCIHRRPWLSYY